MTGTIEFHHDVANDIVIVTPRWKIETVADIATWQEQWENWFDTHMPGKKSDCVIVLHDFHVGTSVATAWGAARAAMVGRLMRHSFRVDANSKVSFYVNTSGAKYNAATQEAATVADAIAGILHARQARRTDRPRAPSRL
jgi:hypothetical protein